MLIVPTLLLVTIMVFLTVRLIPGSVIDLMAVEAARQAVGVAGESSLETAKWWEELQEAEIEKVKNMLKHQMGLDLPIHVQYGRWMGAVLHGDLGKSIWSGRAITEEIRTRLPVSLELGLIAIITALLIAIPIGVYSAIRQDTWSDYGGRTIAILCISLPSFWLGTLVFVYPSIWWTWSPNIGYIPFASNPVGNLGQFIIPGFIMGMVMSGTTMRMTRTMMLEVLRQDYIRTAWAKGLPERKIILRHTLKNALIPVVTIVGVMLQVLIGGSVVLESIFALPGIGLLLIEAINKRDYPVISGINLILASFVLVINLLVDVTYAYLDPRVHYR